MGAQTRIWTNAAQHTIGDTTYDDAAHYALDDAGNNTENFTWFLDQYGNVIGSVAIDRTGYAVLKDIVWKIGTPAMLRPPWSTWTVPRLLWRSLSSTVSLPLVLGILV